MRKCLRSCSGHVTSVVLRCYYGNTEAELRQKTRLGIIMNTDNGSLKVSRLKYVFFFVIINDPQ